MLINTNKCNSIIIIIIYFLLILVWNITQAGFHEILPPSLSPMTDFFNSLVAAQLYYLLSLKVMHTHKLQLRWSGKCHELSVQDWGF